MVNKAHRTRCRYFNSRGYSRGPGCFRTAAECVFVHPDDPEWDEAPPPHSKPLSRGRGGYHDEPRGRSRNNSRRKDDYDSHYRGGRERSRSRTQSRSSIASTHRSNQSMESNKRINIDIPDQATTSTKPLDLASRLLDPPIQPNLGHTTIATIVPEQSSSSIASSTLNKVPTPARPDIPMSTSTVKAVLPTTSSPDPPPHPQPRQPSSSNDAIPDQEKGQLWFNRIRLLADAIKVQDQIADCEDRIGLAEQSQQTFLFDSLTDERKARRQQELATLKAQHQAKTVALEEIIGKLAALSDGWPKKPSHSQEMELEIETKYQDITRYVQDLKATVDKMQAGLNEISEATSKQEAEEKEPEPSEMELALDRLVELDSKLGTVANEYIGRDRDRKQEISYTLATSMDKLRRTTLRNIMKDDSAILAKEKVEAEINGTREQVEILSNEMADLVTRLDNMNVELSKSRQANYEWKAALERDLKRLQVYENLHNQDMRVIQTLQIALNAYTSKPMSPPPSPVTSGPEFVMDQIRDPLFEVMRSTVQEYMSNARTQLIELMNEQNTGVYLTLWKKLEPTLRILNRVVERLNKGDVEGLYTIISDANIHPS